MLITKTLTFKILILAAIILPISWQCQKKLVGFDMYYRRTFNLSVGLDPFASHNFVSNGITPDTAAFFAANSASSANVLRLVPKSMQIRAIYPGGGTTYDILSKVEVSVYDSTRPKIPGQIIFYRDDVPLGTGSTLDLFPNGVDVKDIIINSRNFSVRVYIQLRQIPNQTIETEWKAYFTAQTQ